MHEFFHDFMNDKGTFIVTILIFPLMFGLISLGISFWIDVRKEYLKDKNEMKKL